ncbi:hypothetical protein BH11VER1_BH11VER1_30120 [soil metagenome]
MMFRCFITCVWLSAGLATPAAEEFHGPEAYPVDRYIPLWDKNPFTLKTAPAAILKETFAKDLALAGITRIGADTTVLLVNTKTREYLRLKNQDTHASGMKVKSVNMKDTRSDSSVEVVMGTETSVLKYDDGFLKQMAAQVPTQAPLNVAANNPAIPVPMMPGAPAPQSMPNGGRPVTGVGVANNQDGRGNLLAPPMPINGSPMTEPPQNRPNVPVRRVRTAPVPRSDPSSQNP